MIRNKMRAVTMSHARFCTMMMLVLAMGLLSWARPAEGVVFCQKKTKDSAPDKVRNSACKGKQVDVTATAASLLPPGPAGPQGPAGAQGTPATSLFAVVSFDANLIRGSGVVSVSIAGDLENTDYFVQFDRDVSECAAIATLDARCGSECDTGEVLVDIGQSGEVSNDTVFVDARTSEGSDTGANRQFHLAVFCP
jgi:hypothetical protein